MTSGIEVCNLQIPTDLLIKSPLKYQFFRSFLYKQSRGYPAGLIQLALQVVIFTDYKLEASFVTAL